MRGSQFKQLSIGVDRMLTDAKAMSEDGGLNGINTFKWDFHLKMGFSPYNGINTFKWD